MLNAQFEKERIEREGMAENYGDHLLQKKPANLWPNINSATGPQYESWSWAGLHLDLHEKATCGFVMQTTDFLGKTYYTYCCIQ